MRLPRMTTRRWMVAVAVAGLAMRGLVGSIRLKRWRVVFLLQARDHAKQEALWRRSKVFVNRLIKDGYIEDAQPLERRIAYHAAMAHKYDRAARYPWLPVEPDPPEPK